MGEDENQKKSFFTRMSEKVRTAATKRNLEETYTKKVYPMQAKIASTVSDALPVSLEDVMTAGKIGANFLPNAGALGVVKQAIKVTASVQKAQAMVGLKMNLLRGPLEQKLDIELEDKLTKEDLEQDITLLCDRLTKEYALLPTWMKDETGAIKDIKLSDVLADSEIYMNQIMKELDGVEIRSPKRVKRSLRMELMSKLGVRGQYNLLTHEITLPSSVYHEKNTSLPFVLCHEKVHAKGHIREYVANTIAYLACKRSENPLFMYSGDLERLNYTLRCLYDPETMGKGPNAIARSRKAMTEHVLQLPLPDNAKESLLASCMDQPSYKTTLQYGFRKLTDTVQKSMGDPYRIKSYSERFIKVLHAYEKRLGEKI